jgi:hypothetical protein
MDFKLELVEKSYQPGACVAQLAREHGINDNLLFTWRQRYSHLCPMKYNVQSVNLMLSSLLWYLTCPCHIMQNTL